MAKPIKETPTLRGKDAQKFIKAMEAASGKKVDSSELKKMRDSFNKLSAISTF